jgi:hypothetical protein
MRRGLRIALSTAIGLGAIAAFVRLAGLGFPALMLWMFFTQAASPGCEQRKELASATSPDGAWVASITDNVCSDGLFVTTYTDEVELRRPDEPMEPEPSPRAVFALDNVHSKRDVLAVTWLEPRSLEISIPNEAWIGVQQTTYRDVRITYKYVPDDPVQRACLGHWRSLVQERVALSQDRAAIDAFFAKCRAAGGRSPELR